MQTTSSHSPAQSPAAVPPALVSKSSLRTHQARRALSDFLFSGHSGVLVLLRLTELIPTSGHVPVLGPCLAFPPFLQLPSSHP